MESAYYIFLTIPLPPSWPARSPMRNPRKVRKVSSATRTYHHSRKVGALAPIDDFQTAALVLPQILFPRFKAGPGIFDLQQDQPRLEHF